uniref:Putative odorant-binding protein 56e obp n=1 Tax=Corethrella appendiculata TaxID=1370023 RepID=U5ERI6_9DIPT
MKILFKFVIFSLLISEFVMAEENKEEEMMLEERKTMLREMTKECQEKEGTTDDDLEHLMGKNKPETDVQKCYLGCIDKQFGITDGKMFNEEGFLSLIEKLKYGEEKMHKAKEVAEACKEMENEDQCLLGESVWMCLKDAGWEWH